VEERSPREILIQALIMLTANLIAVWAVLPPDERMWVRLRAAHLSRRALDVLARREGRAGMADELAGRDPGARYVTAYRLGLLRDRLTSLVRP